MIRTIIKDYEEERIEGEYVYCRQSTLTKEAIDYLKLGEEVTAVSLQELLHCTEIAAWAVLGMLYHYGCIEPYDYDKYHFCLTEKEKCDILGQIKDPIPATIRNYR